MMLHNVRWTVKKISQRIELIEPLVYRRQYPLPSFRYITLPDVLSDPPVGLDVDVGDWSVLEPNTYWGTWMTDYALRTTFQVPGDWEHNLPVALYLPLGEAGDFSHPEALAYVDGAPYAGCDRHHQEILLPDQWRDGQEHLLALHTWTGLGGWRFGEPGTKLFMRPCSLVQIDQPTRDFVAAARVALGIAKSLDENEPAKGHLLNALDEAFKILDTREPFGEGFYTSVAPAHTSLRAGIEKAGQPMDVDVVSAGHAHIDVAWLWTLGQTRRKSGRTFHTVLRLMEQFPDYHFTQSQPQLYDYIQKDYPGLLDAIKERVAEGRWEPIGGMWVEADCNLTGAEALARQFLLGRSFFREHFGPGADSPVLWLPDVFGYAWALPQLIKQAGLDYFMTIKIGWNQYNRLPYDSFWWQGLDGTKVLTHFSTTPEPGGGFSFGVSTYNARAEPEQAIATWTNFQQKELQQELLMIYGFGDGGGGPTREMLENIREMGNFPATPHMRQDSVGNFFHNLEETSGHLLPTWNAELYFELHRGTYTTQSRSKRANRKSEFLLHDAEFLATQAALLDPGYEYPKGNLRKAWELVCLNQFHDIIPGSSINAVYVESLQQYAEVEEMGLAARDAALAAISRCLGHDLLIVNPTSFARDDLAFWPGHLEAGKHLRQVDGTPLAVQSDTQGTWVSVGELPPFSVNGLTIDMGEAPALETDLTATPTLLENRFLRVEFDEAGDIVRILDKANDREVLPTDVIANQFQAFEDRPMEFDAWDVDIYFDDKMWTADPATSIQVVEEGPLRATLEVRRRILNSDYVQRISLAYNSAQLDFDTSIDWCERHIMLKVAFPVDIMSPIATYEIQWGNVERPTHRNTSWDWARFETCAQMWVDLSEGGYGVSLLNDCKYGHDVKDNVMRISLLRSPTSPDPEADQGKQRFTYSLLPHIGSWNETTIASAYALNDPLIAWRPSESPVDRTHSGQGRSQPLVSVDQPNIIIETIKQAENGNDVIVRLYESQRRRGKVTLTTSFNLAEAWHTNLMEEPQTSLAIEGNNVSLFVKPYEIVTLQLKPA
ncbi:MAG: alpha-mannosidase [Anaerolineales bacterium]|nr:alpha-mannosidase [Anaerolineales bacterium]